MQMHTLIIDQGTHATRALLFDAAGQVVATARQPIGLTRHSADRIEQDGEEIRASVTAVLQQILSESGLWNSTETRLLDLEEGSFLTNSGPKDSKKKPGFSAIQAGVASQRSSVIAWDRQTGRPLSPVLSWQDRRAHAWLSQFEPQAAAIKERNGLPLSPHYGASKLRWLLDNVDTVQEAARNGRLAFGPLASYVLFHLLDGQPMLVDQANAARTQLWQLDSRNWDPWLLTLFGVPMEPLPRCVPIRHDYGRIAQTDIPVTAVNGDQNAAVYALGRPQPGTAIINLGTGAFILVPTGDRLLRHDTLLTGLTDSDAHSSDYTLEGTVNGAGAALSWAADQLGLGPARDHLDNWLAATPEPPLFINSIGGLGSPFWRPGPDPHWQGEAGPMAKMAAVAESILFLLYANMETMLAAGVTIEQLRLSGGLARSDALCRRLADLTQRPVVRPAETEATARGTAWLAAGQPDHWPEAAPGSAFTPQPNPLLQERYRRFLQVLS
jgi:glycerol kinase